jgi:hypothetical protein
MLELLPSLPAVPRALLLPDSKLQLLQPREQTLDVWLPVQQPTVPLGPAHGEMQSAAGVCSMASQSDTGQLIKVIFIPAATASSQRGSKSMRWLGALAKPGIFANKDSIAICLLPAGIARLLPAITSLVIKESAKHAKSKSNIPSQ